MDSRKFSKSIHHRSTREKYNNMKGFYSGDKYFIQFHSDTTRLLLKATIRLFGIIDRYPL